MKKFLDAMMSRYTTKVYDATCVIDEDVLEELKEIMRMSPSSINSQPWQFTFVSDRTMKERLAKVSYFNEEKINDCHTLVVLSCRNDTLLFEEWMHSHLSQGSIDYYNRFIAPLSPIEKTDWFAKQMYIALGVLLSACAVMGIDSSPMEGIEGVRYDAILEQNHYHALVAVALGYRSSDDYNDPSRIAKMRRGHADVIITL